MFAIMSKVQSFLMLFKWYRNRYISVYQEKIEALWYKTGKHTYDDVCVIPTVKEDFARFVEKAGLPIKKLKTDFAVFYLEQIGKKVFPIIYTNFIPDMNNLIHQCILAHEYGHWVAVKQNLSIRNLPIDWEVAADLWAAEKIGISTYVTVVKEILENLYGHDYHTIPENQFRLNNLESHMVKHFDSKAFDDFVSTTIQ